MKTNAMEASENKAANVMFAFVNMATGKALEHIAGRTAVAVSPDFTQPNRQWILQSCADDGFVVLVNRSTGLVLDHYYGRSVEAFDSDMKHPHHHWKLVPLQDGKPGSPAAFAVVNRATGMALAHGNDGNATKSQVVKCIGQSGAGDSYGLEQSWRVEAVAHEVVGIVNKCSGMALDHFYGRSVQAFNADLSHPHHQWILERCEDGYFAIVNLATGMALDHYRGHRIAAYNNDVTHPHHQWKFVPHDDASFAIVNRATGMALDHFYGMKVEAFNSDTRNGYHRWWVKSIAPRGIQSLDQLHKGFTSKVQPNTRSSTDTA